MDIVVRDSNGNPLADGDTVLVIKDLKVKGSSVTLKRGTTIKNIRLNGSDGEIEANHEKVKGLVLKTEFLRKAWAPRDGLAWRPRRCCCWADAPEARRPRWRRRRHQSPRLCRSRR